MAKSQNDSSVDEEIRAAVRELRRRLGMNQVEFSLKSGLSYGAVQKFEQKKAPHGGSALKLTKLAQSLGHSDLALQFARAAFPIGMDDWLRQDVLTFTTEFLLSHPTAIITSAVRLRERHEARLLLLLFLCLKMLTKSEQASVEMCLLSALRSSTDVKKVRERLESGISSLGLSKEQIATVLEDWKVDS